MRSQEHLVADDHHRVDGRVYKLLKNTKEQMNTTLSGTTACYVGYPIYSSCEPQPCCQTSRQTLVAFHFQATCKIHAPSSKHDKTRSQFQGWILSSRQNISLLGNQN